MVTRQAALDVFGSYVGMRERTNQNDILFTDHYASHGMQGQAWCLAMVMYGFETLGEQPFLSFWCPYGVQWARNNGQSVEWNGGAPIPGDVVYFTWDGGRGSGSGDHVGIVERYDGGDTVYTIEGNVGPEYGGSYPQGVHRRTRSISGTVINYWRPAFYTDTGEEDMTEDQARILGEIRNLVGGAFDQTVAANKRLDGIGGKVDEVRNLSGGAHDQTVAANKRLISLSSKVDERAAEITQAAVENQSLIVERFADIVAGVGGVPDVVLTRESKVHAEEVATDIQAGVDELVARPPATAPEIDYKKLAQAIIKELPAGSTTDDILRRAAAAD